MISVWASGPFGSDDEIDRAFEESEVIFQAEVVSHTEVWTCGGDLISDEKRKEIFVAVMEFNEGFIEKFGIADDGAESRAYRKKWEDSELGSLYEKGIKGLEIVTVKVLKAEKGDLGENFHNVTLAWTLSFMPTCSHVLVSRNVGDEVQVFLKKGWREVTPAIPERLFLMGAKTLRPKLKK